MGTLFNVLMYCVAFGALLAMLSSLVGIAFWLLKLVGSFNQNEWIQELHWLTSVMIPPMLQSFQIG
jgi:hypothetical protein